MDLGFIGSLFTISRPPHAISTAQANSIHDSKDAVLEGAEVLFAWFFRRGTKSKTPPVRGFFDQSKSEQ